MKPRNKKREKYCTLAFATSVAAGVGALTYLLSFKAFGPDANPVWSGLAAFVSFASIYRNMSVSYDNKALVDSADLYREEALKQQKQ